MRRGKGGEDRWVLRYRRIFVAVLTKAKVLTVECPVHEGKNVEKHELHAPAVDDSSDFRIAEWNTSFQICEAGECSTIKTPKPCRSTECVHVGNILGI
jgi:hypothetical protein